MGFSERIKKVWHNHSLMMVICCAVPLVLIAGLYFLGFSNYAFWLVLLLCPIMHLFMMKDMGHSKHSNQQTDGMDNHEQGSQQAEESKGDAKCH